MRRTLALLLLAPLLMAMTWWPDPSPVYVIDRTGGLFPVHRAAELWDNGSALNLVSRSRCPDGAQCIRVKLYDDLPVGVAGRTHLRGNAAGQTTWARIRLDPDMASYGWRVRRNLALHEIGHAIGLDHSADPSSAVWPVIQRDVVRPSPQDYRNIELLYGP